MSDRVEADRVKGRESVVTIACCQCEPKVGYPQENLEKSVELIERAVKDGADFIILPELANSGYVFNNKQEARNIVIRMSGQAVPIRISECPTRCESDSPGHMDSTVLRLSSPGRCGRSGCAQ